MVSPSTSAQVPTRTPLPPRPDDEPEAFRHRRLRSVRVAAGLWVALLVTEAVAFAGTLARRHAGFGAGNPAVDRAIVVPGHPIRR